MVSIKYVFKTHVYMPKYIVQSCQLAAVQKSCRDININDVEDLDVGYEGLNTG